MCGIAGIIYRNGGGERQVGRDMTAMLQAMKHRGPDSTGYGLYRGNDDSFVMHVKLSEAVEEDADLEQRVKRQRDQVEARIRGVGADIEEIKATHRTMTIIFSFDGDLKVLADAVERVRHTEVLSLGRSLEIVKDLGDAETVSAEYHLKDSPAPTRSATPGWRPSPTSTSPTPIPTGLIPSPTSRSSTTGS